MIDIHFLNPLKKTNFQYKKSKTLVTILGVQGSPNTTSSTPAFYGKYSPNFFFFQFYPFVILTQNTIFHLLKTQTQDWFNIVLSESLNKLKKNIFDYLYKQHYNKKNSPVNSDEIKICRP